MEFDAEDYSPAQISPPFCDYLNAILINTKKNAHALEVYNHNTWIRKRRLKGDITTKHGAWPVRKVFATAVPVEGC